MNSNKINQNDKLKQIHIVNILFEHNNYFISIPKYHKY
jgi:hypothetical protein